MSGAKRQKHFCRAPALFLALKEQSDQSFLSASVWSVQLWPLCCFFCSSYSRCPRAQSSVKVWARAHVPWIESVSLSCYSSTQKKHYKTTILSECIVSLYYFLVFAFKVTHRVILFKTRFCKLLTRVATLSGGGHTSSASMARRLCQKSMPKYRWQPF